MEKNPFYVPKKKNKNNKNQIDFSFLNELEDQNSEYL